MKPFTQNYHVLRVTYSNESITVKSLRFDQSIRISKYAPRANEVGSYMEELVIPELQQRGFNIIGKAEFGTTTDVVITDTFKPFKEEIDD